MMVSALCLPGWPIINIFPASAERCEYLLYNIKSRAHMAF